MPKYHIAKSPPATIATCTVCGAHWRKPITRSRAQKCPDCFKWSRVSFGIQMAATAIREGRQ